MFGWAIYDAGNSAFATTVVGAVLAVYLQNHVVPEDGIRFFQSTWNAESLWGLVTGVGPLIALVAMPVFGAIADRSNTKGSFLRFCSYGCALLTVVLSLAGEGDVFFVLGVFLAALILFSAANVFYDGFLTDISTAESVHRISARGVAYGYLGGAAHLILGLGLIALLPSPLGSRLTIASAGVWFALFTYITFRHLPSRPQRPGTAPAEGLLGRLRDGTSDTLTIIKQVRRLPDLWKFVVAHMLYGNALQTFVVLTAVYSAETLQLGQTTIIAAFLVVQILSFPACYGASRLASRTSPGSALTTILMVWIAAFGAAYLLPAGQTIPYLGLAVVVGLVLGPASALSRSIFATMIPREAPAQFFGFYSLTTKFSAIWGPLLFTLVRQTTGSGRLAIVSIVVFLVAGMLLVRKVDIERGREALNEWELAEAGD